MGIRSLPRTPAGNSKSRPMDQAATATETAPEWREEDRQVSYPEALAAMEARVEAIRAGTAPELVWLRDYLGLAIAAWVTLIGVLGGFLAALGGHSVLDAGLRYGARGARAGCGGGGY